ncbi:hypothetical protein QLQ15_17620 [Lysobacter sp. LF1]|uniref:Putative tail fiber protein gp53-like C-terminal domain-containing protein n=1 Tax=Lysobacter stagni TaxID=3045172 RepID=A0ABT6XLV2_9GAMM|nr:hypothetical protein [Lysobacter sp. LF1]MDI9240725.1 hypothetical protein [Lysobacter sp. LF1]
MDRISTPARARDLHGPGKDGFQDGDVFTGRPATEVGAAWMNDFQEAQMRVIEAAMMRGESGNHGLLLDAILWHISHSVSEHAEHFASADALLAHIRDRENPHGVTLDQLGAAPRESPDFTGSPRAPTQATNDNSTLVATTAFVRAAIAAILGESGMLGGFTHSFTQNGWHRDPSGKITQWGRYLGVRREGTGPTITFPVAFPNACLSVAVFDWNRSGGGNGNWEDIDCFIQVTGDPSLTGFSTYVQSPASVADYFEGFFWEATGF